MRFKFKKRTKNERVDLARHRHLARSERHQHDEIRRGEWQQSADSALFGAILHELFVRFWRTKTHRFECRIRDLVGLGARADHLRGLCDFPRGYQLCQSAIFRLHPRRRGGLKAGEQGLNFAKNLRINFTINSA